MNMVSGDFLISSIDNYARGLGQLAEWNELIKALQNLPNDIHFQKFKFEETPSPNTRSSIKFFRLILLGSTKKDNIKKRVTISMRAKKQIPMRDFYSVENALTIIEG